VIGRPERPSAVGARSDKQSFVVGGGAADRTSSRANSE
jgi:hypothetical protein